MDTIGTDHRNLWFLNTHVTIRVSSRMVRMASRFLSIGPPRETHRLCIPP
jgi:hypothetical protein